MKNIATTIAYASAWIATSIAVIFPKSSYT